MQVKCARHRATGKLHAKATRDATIVLVVLARIARDAQPLRILAEPVDERHQAGEVKRLAAVTLDHRGCQSLRSSRHGDDGQVSVRAVVAHKLGERNAIHPRHVQIKKDQTRLQRISETLHGVNAIYSGNDRAPELLEALGERSAKVWVVINDQDASLTWHAPKSAPPMSREANVWRYTFRVRRLGHQAGERASSGEGLASKLAKHDDS